MKALAVAICAPSGAGKTTVARALVEASDDLVFSVSATTRPARPGERPGCDYHFVSDDEFESLIQDGRLVEWAEVHGDFYGTPRANLDEAQNQGAVLILDIDVQGARQVAEALPETVTIFLLPPSFDVLMERLQLRASEDPGRLRRRLETAKTELACVDEFKFVVINDRLEDAVQRIRAIITAEGQSLIRSAAEVDELVKHLLQRLEDESA